jgi:hypothetical protein
MSGVGRKYIGQSVTPPRRQMIDVMQIAKQGLPDDLPVARFADWRSLKTLSGRPHRLFYIIVIQ